MSAKTTECALLASGGGATVAGILLMEPVQVALRSFEQVSVLLTGI